jgi:peptide-methionine (S)-S-oxide reductase
MRIFGAGKATMVEPSAALPGRPQAMVVPARHEVLGTPLQGPFPPGVQSAIFGMGCFWGAERLFWEADGVYTTAVGYAGGSTPNPTYEEACSGRTGHAEVVLVAFDTATTGYADMLKLFWEGHDPTQGMRQGNDVGTQYRSLIMWNDEAQRAAAEASLASYQRMLSAAGLGTITTELAQTDASHPFYYAEDYHQQYLAKNPGGYDCATGTGIACPIGLAVPASTADARSTSSSQ